MFLPFPVTWSPHTWSWVQISVGRTATEVLLLFNDAKLCIKVHQSWTQYYRFAQIYFVSISESAACGNSIELSDFATKFCHWKCWFDKVIRLRTVIQRVELKLHLKLKSIKNAMSRWNQIPLVEDDPQQLASKRNGHEEQQCFPHPNWTQPTTYQPSQHPWWRGAGEEMRMDGWRDGWRRQPRQCSEQRTG